jgi:predicted dienelactone hydrolase
VPSIFQLRVSAPVTGGKLPILLLSHGHVLNHVSSLDGYAALADYYAAHGFVVIQPTHLDSKTLPFREVTPTRRCIGEPAHRT